LAYSSPRKKGEGGRKRKEKAFIHRILISPEKKRKGEGKGEKKKEKGGLPALPFSEKKRRKKGERVKD